MKGLYIHIPFCAKKCEYCDFVSFPGCDGKFEDYVDALIKEMEIYKGAKLDTVFIGGGTPSVLPSFLIGRICDAVKENFILPLNVEWSIEINPGTVTDEKINAMLDGGINRASVGVQSFNDDELRAVGRVHDSRTACDTVHKLERAGFKNISIDLMASLPHQTEESFKYSLDVALTLPVNHISVYSLIIEEGTPIEKKYDSGEYTLPDEDADRDLYAYTGRYLNENGFVRYEISNYAKPGYESKHNLKYWNCDEYIGIGVAAHSYVDGVRYYNTDNLSDYIDGITRVGEDILTPQDKMGEFMMLGLRKTAGVDKREFENRFSCMPQSVWRDVIDEFIKSEFVEDKDGHIALTEKGLDVANSIMCEFL